MTNDPFPVFDYISQRQFGVLFGVSSHASGRWLREMGLRTADGKPTTDAIRTGLAKVVIFAEGIASFYSWDKARVAKLFEDAGHKRPGSAAGDKTVTVTLKGPYIIRANSGDGFEILGGDGSACIWTRGDGNAKVLARVMNIVDRFRSQGLHH